MSTDALDAEQFDPGQHTVEEVVAHLEAHPDEVETVKALEAQGQNRSTVAKFSVQSKDSVTVRVAWPHDEFISNVADVPTITRQGTVIPADKLQAVHSAAERAGTVVVED